MIFQIVDSDTGKMLDPVDSLFHCVVGGILWRRLDDPSDLDVLNGGISVLYVLGRSKRAEPDSWPSDNDARGNPDREQMAVRIESQSGLAMHLAECCAAFGKNKAK